MPDQTVSTAGRFRSWAPRPERTHAAEAFRQRTAVRRRADGARPAQGSSPVLARLATSDSGPEHCPRAALRSPTLDPVGPRPRAGILNHPQERMYGSGDMAALLWGFRLRRPVRETAPSRSANGPQAGAPPAALLRRGRPCPPSPRASRPSGEGADVGRRVRRQSVCAYSADARKLWNSLSLRAIVV